VVLVIDPQMAFGTGEHATTRGCLRLLDDALRPGDRVLDVGSGSGILAIAAARLGASEVIAVEADADANLNARENLALNGVEGQVRLEEGYADAELIARCTFDLILANILSSVIRRSSPPSAPRSVRILQTVLADAFRDGTTSRGAGAGVRETPRSDTRLAAAASAVQ
jgi:ribosomal protein L11 methyltransferase